VNDGTLEDRSAREHVAAWRSREAALGELQSSGGILVVRNHMNQLAVEPIDGAEEGTAQPYGALGDGLEDRLHVGRRAADHAEDLGGRRLLLQGLGHLGMSLRERLVLLLQLGEQAHVLDRDDRLVGKGLDERNLLVRKRPDLEAANENDAERLVLPE